jgi:hypothetical protein
MFYTEYLMFSVNMDETEWNTVMAVLSTGPWNQVNPLLMKIGAQLQAAKTMMPMRPNGGVHAAVEPAVEAEVEAADGNSTRERAPRQPSRR